jgi:hypothetical protein
MTKSKRPGAPRFEYSTFHDGRTVIWPTLIYQCPEFESFWNWYELRIEWLYFSWGISWQPRSYRERCQRGIER